MLAFGLAACGGDVAPETAAGAPVEAPAGEEVRCLPDAIDCDDTPDGDARGGDAMVPEEITLADEVPAGTRAVEMAPGSVAQAWPVFLQTAVVDGADVTVTFSGGEARCFVVDHVETDETPERVIVSVLVGVPDPDADCSSQEIGTRSVSFQLEGPLGERPLKDGSRTVPDGAEA